MNRNRALQHLTVRPLVIAVQVLDGGQWLQARASDWARTHEGWHALVVPEVLAFTAEGAWLPVSILAPSQHPITTLHTAHEWLDWHPPTWPGELAHFADAASNLHQHSRPAAPQVFDVRQRRQMQEESARPQS